MLTGDVQLIRQLTTVATNWRTAAGEYGVELNQISGTVNGRAYDLQWDVAANDGAGAWQIYVR